MPFLLANWRLILLASLIASSALFYKLWREEAREFKAYQNGVEMLGKLAEAEKARIEADHAKTTKEISDAIPKKIAAARDSAVAAYRLRYPDSGNVSCPANDSGGTNATGKEQVAPATPADNFVRDCATDAATVGLWQDWVKGIGFPVK